ncbi:MAG: hypothetical protein PF481_10805 [Bacteroidales bacterium]|jgi:hypothetical protein|nr:hypothetical protein [Bacteroidales bacterium]
MIQLNLSENQFSHLLKLMYMGEWMLQAHNKDSYNVEVEELEQQLYSVAYNMGLDECADYDKKMGGYVPTEEFEEECDTDINAYDEQTFWEELIVRLADKKLEKKGAKNLSQKEFTSLQEKYITEYEEEFEQFGLDRLSIIK